MLIGVQALTKGFGSTVAKDGLSFTMPSRRVTGFLGLAAATSGIAVIDGRRYAQLRDA
jgi:ABC-2 type transport system ATP-binding protein